MTRSEDVLMPTYPPPAVTFVRGEGSRLWDDQGREYLDFLSGLAVTSLGHAHPDVAAALCEQAGTLLHTSNLYGTLPGPEVAGTLDRLIGGGGRVFFANSGAEANECAIKLARKWGGHGRYGVVSAYGSFHGRTLATLHATGQPAKHEAFQPMPEGFRHVAWRDLQDLERAIDPSTAAVLLEMVQGEGGVNPAGAEYVAGVRHLCDERNVLLIVDEVQTGLGRTGEWFAFQHYGDQAGHRHHGQGPRQRRPDRGVLGHRGGGHRLRAGRPRHHLRRPAARRCGGPGGAGRHGGARTSAPGPGPPAPASPRPSSPSRESRNVRGLGLLLAVELDDDQSARDVAARALDAGLVVNAVTAGALRLAPSLLVSEEEIDEAVAVLGRAHRTRYAGGHRGRNPVRHLLEIDDLDRSELQDVLSLAALEDPPPVLAGRGMALIFEKPSNRTRNATEMAVYSLGGHPVSPSGGTRSVWASGSRSRTW